MGPWVLGQDPQKGPPLVFRQFGQKVRGTPDLQGAVRPLGEAAPCVGTGIGVGHIGLDVINGGTVHQVRPLHPQFRAMGALPDDFVQFHQGQAQGIGTERGPGGEDPQTGIASQPGRPHSRRPDVVFGKAPDQPQVGEPFQAPEGFPFPEPFRHFHPSCQIRHQAALPGKAEFFRQQAPVPGHRPEGQEALFLSLQFRHFTTVFTFRSLST